MIDPTSRYYTIETATLTLPDGREVSYLRRRFLPDGEGLLLLSEVAMEPGERIDNLAHRTLGDPLQFWRVCDANDVMNPTETMADPQRLLRIPLPLG